MFILSLENVLGSGVVIGALAHKLFEREQTEALTERIGLNQARDRVCQWT